MRYVIAALLVVGAAWGLKCPVCEYYEETSTVHGGLTTTTQVYAESYYWDEDGNLVVNPDPNIRTTEYRCSRGHEFRELEWETREAGAIVEKSCWEIKVPPTDEDIKKWVSGGGFFMSDAHAMIPVDSDTVRYFMAEWVQLEEMTAELYERCRAPQQMEDGE
jgi:hypothetical protein